MLCRRHNEGFNRVVDKQQRAMLVVPYNAGPPPRAHLALALLCAVAAAVSGLLLFVADYSTNVAGTIAATTATLALLALTLAVVGVRARGRFRVEMERAVEVTPAPDVEVPAPSERAI